jgi:type IV secretory pathway VirB10-like protein
MAAISIAFAAVVAAGIVFSTGKPSNKKQEEAAGGFAAGASREFLQREYERSLRPRPEEQISSVASPGPPEGAGPADAEMPEGLPRAVPVYLAEQSQARPEPRPAQYPPPSPAPAASPAAGQPQPQQQANPHTSSIVARVEGSLFAQAPALSQYAQAQSPYAAQGQAAQSSQEGFGSSGGAQAGFFLPPDILWVGTVIPAVLETAVNTDLPGNVIARVTQNIYDSQTGKKMLVPQGTLLVARYNSSVSYAQRRVQIAWDLLIRPDGYQLELNGMNGVDPRGMAGLQAQYSENWFEYIKAAGIIAMFTVANSRLAAEVAKYEPEDSGSKDSPSMAASVAASNAEFVSQTSGSIISRVLDIQPTLRIDSGERVNIMLNKNLYLPAMQSYPVTRRYALE